MTLYSPCVHNVATGRTLIVPDRRIMVFGLWCLGEGSGGDGGEVLELRSQTDLDVFERQRPSFLSSDTKRLLFDQGCSLNYERLRKTMTKNQKIVISAPNPLHRSTAWRSLCLDSCSLYRCWHRPNKYLCEAPVYPFYKQINQYLLSSQMRELSAASSTGWYSRSAHEVAGSYSNISRSAEGGTYYSIK